ncbi:MAG: hypothetical protein AAGJ35_13910 [Myxococcota bacterium]
MSTYQPLFHIVPMNATQAYGINTQFETLLEHLERTYGKDKVTPEVLDAGGRLVRDGKKLESMYVMPNKVKRKVDKAADSNTASLHNALLAVLQAYRRSFFPLSTEQQQEFDDAVFLIEDIFPHGTGYLNGPWEDQRTITDFVCKRIKSPENQARIQRLALEPRFAMLEQIHEEYGRMLGRDIVDGKAVDPMETWRSNLAHFLVTVLSKHHNHPEMSEMLQKPYLEFIEKQRIARRQERRKALQQSESEQEQDSPAE